MTLSPAIVGMLACMVNFGILIFNLGFTRADALAKPNSNVFSPFGQLIILVWGVAFLLAGQQASSSGYIWWAFALEKTCYVGSWILMWASPNDIPATFKAAWDAKSFTDLLTPTFYCIYGPIDFTFLLLFAYLGMQSMATQQRDAGLKAR